MIWWCAEHKAQDFVQAWNPPQSEESHSCVVGVETGGPCRMVEALLIVKEPNGEWPDDAYERISQRLTRMGGTEQWKNPSYRIAYARLCMDALAGIPPKPVELREGWMQALLTLPPAGDSQ